ncbi:GNAT family N-acetyltransferase [Sphingomonas sp. Sphisp140]|uniref:GNAT family N-acetyltransferase n=1 Tax=Sphingomonas sp. Sphisp140 TaxID=3243019 RepID=UPI0039B0FBF3
MTVDVSLERVSALDSAWFAGCDFGLDPAGRAYPFDPAYSVSLGPERRMIAVARIDGRVAGYAACQRDGDAGEVRRLEIDHAARGQGLGRLLLGEARRWAGEQGLAALVLETMADNPAAGRFFAHQGFVLIRQAKALHWQLTLRD